MQQEFLLLAEAAESANGKIFIHGGGVDRHSVLADARPPLQLRADIALGILTDWHETNRTHVLAVTICTEDGKTVWKMEGQFEVGRPPGAKPGQQFRQLIAVKGPIPLPDRGAFKMVLELDGKEQEPAFRFWVEDLAMTPAAARPE